MWPCSEIGSLSHAIAIAKGGGCIIRIHTNCIIIYGKKNSYTYCCFLIFQFPIENPQVKVILKRLLIWCAINTVWPHSMHKSFHIKIKFLHFFSLSFQSLPWNAWKKSNKKELVKLSHYIFNSSRSIVICTYIYDGIHERSH